jgi:hypothetical protein
LLINVLVNIICILGEALPVVNVTQLEKDTIVNKCKLCQGDHMHKYAHATSTIYVWTKYSEPRFYANRETDLIRKT